MAGVNWHSEGTWPATRAPAPAAGWAGVSRLLRGLPGLGRFGLLRMEEGNNRLLDHFVWCSLPSDGLETTAGAGGFQGFQCTYKPAETERIPADDRSGTPLPAQFPAVRAGWVSSGGAYSVLPLPC